MATLSTQAFYGYVAIPTYLSRNGKCNTVPCDANGRRGGSRTIFCRYNTTDDFLHLASHPFPLSAHWNIKLHECNEWMSDHDDITTVGHEHDRPPPHTALLQYRPSRSSRLPLPNLTAIKLHWQKIDPKRLTKVWRSRKSRMMILFSANAISASFLKDVLLSGWWCKKISSGGVFRGAAVRKWLPRLWLK